MSEILKDIGWFVAGAVATFILFCLILTAGCWWIRFYFQQKEEYHKRILESGMVPEVFEKEFSSRPN